MHTCAWYGWQWWRSMQTRDDSTTPFPWNYPYMSTCTLYMYTHIAAQIVASYGFQVHCHSANYEVKVQTGVEWIFGAFIGTLHVHARTSARMVMWEWCCATKPPTATYLHVRLIIKSQIIYYYTCYTIPAGWFSSHYCDYIQKYHFTSNWHCLSCLSRLLYSHLHHSQNHWINTAS